MLWPEIRTAYPDQWLIIEDLEAHTTADNQRHLERIAIIESCLNGSVAMQRYRLLHQQHPQREFYFVHTSRQKLDIRERQWLGIRHLTIKSRYKKQEFYHGEHRGHREKQENSVLSVPLWRVSFLVLACPG